jgi:hypothetical protein
MQPNGCFVKINKKLDVCTVEKSSPKISNASVIFKKLPAANNNDNWPNLFTLFAT